MKSAKILEHVPLLTGPHVPVDFDRMVAEKIAARATQPRPTTPWEITKYPAIVEPSAGLARRIAEVSSTLSIPIPPRYRRSIDLGVAKARTRLSAREITRTAARIFRGEVTSVVLFGESGAGKSNGAALLVGELERLVVAYFSNRAHKKDPCGHPLSWWQNAVGWVSCHELAYDVDCTGLGQGEPELVQQARTAKILILDDLGNENGRTAGSNGVPTSVIQHRYDNEFITIITTGLTTEESSARYGVGITRRLDDPNDPTMVFLAALKEMA